MTRFEELLAEYLETQGQKIWSDGTCHRDDPLMEELVSLVRKDESLRREFLELAAVDGLLRAEFAPAQLDANLLERISMCLVSPEREEELAKQVVERISRRRTPIGLGSRRRSTFPWLAAAACMTAAVAASFLYGLRSSPGPVLTATAEGTTLLRGRTELRAERGIVLMPGDRLRTRHTGGTTITWGAEQARFTLGRWTELELSAYSPAIDVLRGELIASFSGPRNTPFKFSSTHAVAEVLGTELALFVDRAATRIEVLRGHVRLTRSFDGAQVEVGPAQAAVAARGAELSPKLASPRVREGLIALYQFNEGSGEEFLDAAPTETPSDIILGDSLAARWLESAFRFELPSYAESKGFLPQPIDGLTIETWVSPSELTADGWWGVACMLSVWSETAGWEISLGQGAEYGRSTGGAFYVMSRLLSGGTQLIASAPADAGDAPAHVLLAIERGRKARFYLNGKEVSHTRLDPAPKVSASDLKLSIGNDSSRTHPWLGTFHMVAIYGRALSGEEASRNFACGVD